MSFIDNIKRPIASEMKEFENIFSKVLDSDNWLLKNVHEYIMEGSGKKLRPILTILSAKLFGEITQATLYAAFSLELLHTASLVHDDVIDDTMERRGRPSVNAKWNNKVTVLTGDYILSKSLNSAYLTKDMDIMGAISNIGMILPDGELLQLANNSQSAITEEEYFKIVDKKTAMLFATCTLVGGLSVGIKGKELEHLKKFGEYLGICFQIKDDIFDYYEDANIGKPTGNDVRDGKVTLPLIYALNNTKTSEKDKIIKLIDNKDFTSENINKIMLFAHENGGVEYAIKRMDDFVKEAENELTFLPQNEINQALKDCIHFVAERDF
ncbi:Polyprenyl synthetase [uncultured Paludibacter sp.]|nr:Polyprenyl synthetase [uncultured Paludibacter sp.]